MTWILSNMSQTLHLQVCWPPINFWQANRGLNYFLSLQGMHSLWKHIILEASLCLFSFDKIPSAVSSYKASLFVKKCPKGPLFSLYIIPSKPLFSSPCLPFYFPFYPPNPPKIPLKFYPYLFFSHFPLSLSIVPFLGLQIPFKWAKTHFPTL